MNVLIIGGTGFISGAIAEHAHAAGHTVTLFNRGVRDLHTPYTMILGDVADLPTLHAHALRHGRFDVVVHCIANTAQHGADLAHVFSRQAMPGQRAPHIIALSSVDCYQAFWDAQKGLSSAGPLTEKSPLCRKKHYWKHVPGRGDYDKNLMTEAIMRANTAGDLNATVFRVSAVYGPQDRQFAHRHGAIIRHLTEGHSSIALTKAQQETIMPFTYIDNIAAAVVHSFGNQKTMGMIYNLADTDVMPWRLWVEAFSAVAGRPLSIRTMPDPGAHQPLRLVVDSSRFHRHTGFVPPVDLTTAVCLTYAWAAANPACLKDVAMPKKRTPTPRTPKK